MSSTVNRRPPPSARARSGHTAAPAAPAASAAPPAWWSTAAGLVAAVNALIVVGLWARNESLSQLTEAGGALTALGRLAGLIAAELLLVQVVFMARLPWLERSYGQDRLARWHRWTGFTSFNLMLAHIGFITLGYAASEHATVLDELWRLLTTYPGMLLAAAATVALCMVVVTSVRAARRRLRYESWHLLHLYAYLGIALALPHELWTGADFVTSPLARAYWWSTYGVAAGSLLTFRLGVPVWRSLRHRLVVSHVVPEASGVVSVYLRGRRLDRLPVAAGQFFLWRFLDGPGWTRAHPYSLSAAPRPEQLRITVKDLGDGSGRVPWIRRGTRVLVEGPYGRLTPPPHDSRPITMLACGVGITPLRALLDSLPGPVSLLYRARDARDIVFREELEDAVAGGRVRVGYLIGRRASAGSWVPAGYRPDLLDRWVPGIAEHHVYVCGPDAWMASAMRAVESAGVPRERIHSERFSW
jgi:predicted ferric reductase